jgi:D-tyrosyl-tRNA(Tyr) deacylase
VERGDPSDAATRAAHKLLHLRIFDDEARRMNRSVKDVGGQVLLVSQFTLAASTRRGRRPSFDAAAAPEEAEPLLEALAAALRREGVEVASGRFGATMEVELVNDGPVTFVLEL